VEGDRTFTGLTRFSEIPVAAPLLRPYGQQVVGTLVPLANLSGAWERETFLRDSYRSAAAAAGAAPGDWILGLDLDEVPRRELVALLKRCARARTGAVLWAARRGALGGSAGGGQCVG